MSETNNKPNDFEHELREMYKERNTRISFKKPATNSSNLGVILIYLIVSLVGGFIAAIVLLGWFLPLSLGSNQSPSMMTVVTDKESSLAGDISHLSHSTVAIFLEQSVSDKNPLWQRAYLLNKALGAGLILSSDGWIVSTNQVVTDVAKSYRVVAGNQLYEVKEVVTDPSAPLVYLKIEASGLQPTAFYRLKDITSGSLVVAQGFLGQGSETSSVVRRLTGFSVSGYVKNNLDLINKSEEITESLGLDSPLPEKLLGAPIFTLDGKVVGLSAKGVNLDMVYPLEIMDGVMDNLFSQAIAKRPYLGASVVMLDSVIPFVDKQENLPTSGAWLVSGGNQLAIVAKGPAQKAGLKEGDVILFVDKDRVAGQSLGYLLQQYKPGTEVVMKVWRTGKEIEVKVTLGEVSG